MEQKRSGSSPDFLWFEMAENFKEFTSKSGLQTAFWKNGDEEWCEDCVGYLQRLYISSSFR